ncbi:ferredoxin--NADP reductase [Noviherbaspirillum cavernae]|uniref:ferredoxin--NADP(+) reductase n=1 Tax=Noviherbaspirillum cavernae TaxID=2320862 RepID=A0A418X119_9BURK|nr:ferredoxin--NADP reductase [Noviherbaspirillum cavernae]RJG06055.1 ferredoxin--NADP reductase [Noviherbaspirillum cavernae]
MNADPHASQKATQETITSLHRWTDSLFTFTTTKPDGYSFTAGQYARMGLSDERGEVWRAYSMTSAPHEEQLEFYGIVVEGGLFTSRLRKLEPGDSIWIEKQTYGFMTVDRFVDGEDLWMLATGTGIGPYISILRDAFVWEKFRNLILVHCVRHANELAYQNELDAMQRRPPATIATPARLQIIRSTTREAALLEPAARLHGRITTLINNGELEKKAGIALSVSASRIMLCGNPVMIEDTRHILHQRGMRPVRRALPGQFVTENYW